MPEHARQTVARVELLRRNGCQLLVVHQGNEDGVSGLPVDDECRITARTSGRTVVHELNGAVVCAQQRRNALPPDAQRLRVVAVGLRPFDESSLLLGNDALQRVDVQGAKAPRRFKLPEQQRTVGLQLSVGIHGSRVAAFHEHVHHFFFTLQQQAFGQQRAVERTRHHHVRRAFLRQLQYGVREPGLHLHPEEVALGSSEVGEGVQDDLRELLCGFERKGFSLGVLTVGRVESSHLAQRLRIGRMLLAQQLLLQADDLLFKCDGFRQVANGKMIACEVGQRLGVVGMLRSEHGLAYVHGLCTAAHSLFSVACFLIVVGQVAQRRGVFGMAFAIDGLARCQCFLFQSDGNVVLSYEVMVLGQVVQRLGIVGMIPAQRLFADAKSFLPQPDGFAVVTDSRHVASQIAHRLCIVGIVCAKQQLLQRHGLSTDGDGFHVVSEVGMVAGHVVQRLRILGMRLSHDAVADVQRLRS